jgi:hypothetical protein
MFGEPMLLYGIGAYSAIEINKSEDKYRELIVKAQ